MVVYSSLLLNTEWFLYIVYVGQNATTNIQFDFAYIFKEVLYIFKTSDSSRSRITSFPINLMGFHKEIVV